MPDTPSKRRLRAFRALTLAFPVLFFVLVESGLRLFDYGPNLDLFVRVDSPPAGEAYLTTNPDVALRYFSRVGRTPRPPWDAFLEDKPPNGYRVFVMGGSTAAGWPYPNNVMFSRVLDRRLSDAFPDRRIEVVNVGIAAVNSFTLLDFVDEILDYEPDAFLIYAGHNEFYGALGAASVESLGNARWIVNTYLSLLDSRIVRLMRDMAAAVGEWRADARAEADYERTHPTLMSRMIARSVPYGSGAYRAGETNFRENLDDILDRIAAAGVPVLVSELVSNVRDMPPFVSVQTDEHPPAQAIFDQARALEGDGRYDEARAAYDRARDLDALRFRASGDFNGIIREVASAHGVPVVPMEAYFEAASPHGLIGANLMLEHLHPNADGHLLMADAFFESMREHGFIAGEWDATPIRPAAWYAENWPVTELDRALGRLRAMDLMAYWPFRPLSEPGTAFEDFQPASPAEALAYRVAKDELDYVQAHIDLGDLYAAAGDLERAAREYQAIAAADPLGGR
jgi:lysophospholipase L1-like esterase